MLARLDAFLLDKAQKFCDAMQRLTGLTKFFFQKWSMIAVAVLFWYCALLTLDPVLIAGALIFTVLLTLLVRIYEGEEKRFLSRNELEYSQWRDSNRRKFALFSHGILGALLLASSSVIARPFFLTIVCVTVWVYFCACVPRPPSKSKMREWLEKGLTALRDSLPPAPIPISDR